MKKNILYFTRTMDIGGTEKIIMQLCSNFKDKFNKIIVCSAGGVHVRELKDLGIKHYEINDIQNKKIKNIFNTFRQILKIIKNEEINIIHTHHRMAAFYVSIIKKNKKILHIHTAHNTFTDKKKLTQIALGNANIIAVGENVKKNLEDNYKLKNDKITVIYNGIKNTRNFKPIEILSELKDKGYFLVGNIGRLSEQKGIKYFIEAAKLISEQNEKIKFIIVGNGELELELKRMVSDFNLNEKIIFLGYRNDIPNVIEQLDLVVLSSLWEGLPLVPIEAFMKSKTIVATNVDGTPEIVENYINGILINAANSVDIKNAILKIYEDEDLKKLLEDNAYKTYKEKFNIDSFIDNHDRYYKKIVNY